MSSFLSSTQAGQESAYQTNDKVDSLHIVMQIWEQEFAWTEADKPVKLAARALTVPKGSSLNQQPMFCFQTMLKMWYWSGLVYDHQRVRSSCTVATLTVKCPRGSHACHLLGCLFGTHPEGCSPGICLGASSKIYIWLGSGAFVMKDVHCTVHSS